MKNKFLINDNAMELYRHEINEFYKDNRINE